MTLTERAQQIAADPSAEAIEQFLRDTSALMKRATWSALYKTGMRPDQYEDLYSEAMVCTWKMLNGEASRELQSYEYEAILFRRVYSAARARSRIERQRGLAGFSTRVRRNEYLTARQRELEALLERTPTRDETLAYARQCLQKSGRNVSKQGMNLSEEDFGIAVTYSLDGQEVGRDEGYVDSFEDDLLKQDVIKAASRHSMTAGMFAREMFGPTTLTAKECGRSLGLDPTTVSTVQEVLSRALASG